MLHGLYWLAVTCAERSPLALVVDDAQWAHPASERFLAYLARRLDGLRVLLLVARRGPGAGEPPGPAELTPAATLSPRALSANATGQLVRSLVSGASEALVRVCHSATGGNPFYVHELAYALRDETDMDAGSVEGWGPKRIVGAARAYRCIAGRRHRGCPSRSDPR